ncbi:MAG: CDP-alcohol phosphatidyltransferase family protein [Gammaproteobacteria bacterium]|nr:CDP-alcohol phosphatidyltransferase family protein [Gammaproteobacteria bacterium]
MSGRAPARTLFSPANLLTLLRLPAGVLVAQRAAIRRPPGPLMWLALVLACTLSDWFDGPLARRLGPTRFGAFLDLEADSWLTLWAAVAARRCAGVSRAILIAPVVRYPLTLLHLQRSRSPVPYRDRAWQRAAGAAQMTVLVGALAPWGRVNSLAQRLAIPAATLQCAALSAIASETVRRTG